MGQDNHSRHWGINPPTLKNTTPFFLTNPTPLKPRNCPSPPPVFRQSSPIYCFFKISPIKVGSFSEPQKYYSFWSLIPPYLLKVTKFLGKISQFEFLDMTEKNIFA